jgi:hypothetical protein
MSGLRRGGQADHHTAGTTALAVEAKFIARWFEQRGEAALLEG